MNFEQMKVLWDEQDQKPLFAVDETALYAGIRRGARKFQHMIVFSHASIVATWCALAALFLVAPLSGGEHLHRIASAVILLMLAGIQGAGLLRRRRGETAFEASVRGELERAIWRIDHDVRWARSLRIGAVPLFLLAISIDLVFQWTPTYALTLAGAVALVAGASWALEWEVRSEYLPKKRRYEAIHSKLVASEN
jgi:hypothetical protein